MIPKPLLFGVLGLLVIILALVTTARLTGHPNAAQAPTGPILEERVLFISGDLDGSAHIEDAQGRTIADFKAGEAVFISTIARVMERERTKSKADLGASYVLRLREGNRLALYDPQTDRETELVSFGSDNVAAFQTLLTIPAL